MNIKQQLRAGTVKRWHIVAVARDQTIADHMYRVQLLSSHFLQCLGLFDWSSSITLNTMEWARLHDLPEVETGDRPSCSVAYWKVNQMALRKSFPAVAELDETVHVDCPLAGAIVKTADLVEALDYIRTWGMGPQKREVIEDLQRKIPDARQEVCELFRRYYPSSDGLAEDLAVKRFVNEVKELSDD